MIPPRIPTIFLNNGLCMPVLGLGTWKSKAGEVIKAVQTAIDLGYRHIDCALFYQNEHEVGLAIKDKIINKAIKREDLFITGKLWNTFHRPDLVEPAIQKSLCDLQTDYLDLYLIHWPMAYKENRELVPIVGNKILYSNVHYTETWKAMEELVKKRLTKSIGVANFNKRQLEEILHEASIKPVNNQVECHPYLNQKNLMRFCKAHDITLTCYSPLGSPDRPWAKPDEPTLLEDPRILEVADRYCKTSAQIMLRYQIQRGNIVIPKSVTPSRIRENMEIFDFNLTFTDMQEIDGMNKGIRYVALKGDSSHPHYPFGKDEF